MKYFAELGQNKNLSLAELSAVYPNTKIIALNEKAIIFESDKKIDINKLGGMPKLAELVEKGSDYKKIILNQLTKMPKDKKIFFGISFYGKPNKNLGKEIKKELKDRGFKVRWTESKEKILSSVFIKTNKLLNRGGDFCIFDGYVARTVAVQDFADYEFRDIRRPARDLVSGMTPPKLAKLLINLGGPKDEMLDPFCGSGTFLMEAALLGIKNIYGSDISDKAISDSEKNIKWLKEKYIVDAKIKIKKCDVKDAKGCWQKKFKLIVGEPYLGPPVRGKLSSEKAKALQKELQKNYEGYLPAIASLLEKGGNLVLIVPFIVTLEKNIYLDLDIKKYGFISAQKPILYSRPDQKIGRQIYVLNLK